MGCGQSSPDEDHLQPQGTWGTHSGSAWGNHSSSRRRRRTMHSSRPAEMAALDVVLQPQGSTSRPQEEDDDAKEEDDGEEQPHPYAVTSQEPPDDAAAIVAAPHDPAHNHRRDPQGIEQATAEVVRRPVDGDERLHQVPDHRQQQRDGRQRADGESHTSSPPPQAAAAPHDDVHHDGDHHRRGADTEGKAVGSSPQISIEAPPAARDDLPAPLAGVDGAHERKEIVDPSPPVRDGTHAVEGSHPFVRITAGNPLASPPPAPQQQQQQQQNDQSHTTAGVVDDDEARRGSMDRLRSIDSSRLTAGGFAPVRVVVPTGVAATAGAGTGGAMNQSSGDAAGGSFASRFANYDSRNQSRSTLAVSGSSAHSGREARPQPLNKTNLATQQELLGKSTSASAAASQLRGLSVARWVDAVEPGGPSPSMRSPCSDSIVFDDDDDVDLGNLEQQ